MIIPNLSISRAPSTPLRCAIALESEIWDPVAAALRSGFMPDKSAIATGTLVNTQFPIAMLFTSLTLSFPGSAKQSADGGIGFFHSETKRVHAVAIDQRAGRSGINHQRARMIVYGNRDEQMITVASL